MAKPVNISAARRDLPSLFDRVTRRDGEKVVIRRRDGGREAVLVSRDYVERLERTKRQVVGTTAFRLLGSGELLVPVEEAVANLRAAEERDAAKRLAELAPRPGRR
ncbi:MAG TPA: hypothetical protein VGQ83_10445 [Polyangia bacterium]|jgi:hypothetical protein